jgi:hypothetical protein
MPRCNWEKDGNVFRPVVHNTLHRRGYILVTGALIALQSNFLVGEFGLVESDFFYMAISPRTRLFHARWIGLPWARSA